MNLKLRANQNRRGASLLELVIASSMLAIVMTAVGVVMRTGRLAWEAHEADYERVEAAHATLRHIVRRARQSVEVAAITPSTDNSGQLWLVMPDDSIEVWDHDGGTSTVNYGVTAASNLLANNITGLRFIGYEADGATTTTTASDVRAMQVEVSVQLPVESGGARTARSWVWLRSW
jgi:type II secretory pathway pseudopilin PulG